MVEEVDSVASQPIKEINRHNEINMNIVGSNDFIHLETVSDVDGVLTCKLVSSSRPSGGEELSSMTLIYDYMYNEAEIKDAGEEFDDVYIVQ